MLLRALITFVADTPIALLLGVKACVVPVRVVVNLLLARGTFQNVILVIEGRIRPGFSAAEEPVALVAGDLRNVLFFALETARAQIVVAVDICFRAAVISSDN